MICIYRSLSKIKKRKEVLFVSLEDKELMQFKSVKKNNMQLEWLFLYQVLPFPHGRL